jgi:ATP-dependent RNA helicase RhlE
MSKPSFTDLGLSEGILEMLRRQAYTRPTPIQVAAIPALLQGQDVLGIAQTGTGKTAAYGLPLIQKLSATAQPAKACYPQALILTPTRELAAQISEKIAEYATDTELRIACVVGGVDASAQALTLRSGVHVLVATPGRLLDLMRKKHIRLGKITTFVLDEADRMLDMGFKADVQAILKALPADRQSSLCSATMPDEVMKLAQTLLRQPLRIEPPATASAKAQVLQQVYFVERSDKRALLADLLLDPAILRALVFTRTKRIANETAHYLRELGLSAEAIHGDKSQAMRDGTLKSFRKGRIRVLVASDLAARGLDVADITHVFNFDIPEVPETYVHRIGRTARAGRRGVAITFVESQQRLRIRNIEAEIRQVLEVVRHHPFEPKIPVDLEQFRPKRKLSPKPNKKTSASSAKRKTRKPKRGNEPGAS